jgi:hypothetical protein
MEAGIYVGMSACMYVFMCRVEVALKVAHASRYVCMYVCIHACMDMYKQLHILLRMYVCVYVCMHVCRQWLIIQKCTCRTMYVVMRLCICMYVCVSTFYVYIQINTNTFVHGHAYSHFYNDCLFFSLIKNSSSNFGAKMHRFGLCSQRSVSIVFFFMLKKRQSL